MNIFETLRHLREIKKYSLRKVEKKTGISNAYVNQIEKGHIKNISPEKLKLLAECYDFPYIRLMEIAGYIEREIYCPPNIFYDLKLTEKEEGELMNYLQFLRSKKDSINSSDRSN